MTDMAVRAPAAHPAVRRPAIWTVASVRWAALALTLFLAGLAAQLLHAPEFVWWTAYLGGYVSGGWMPARDGLAELKRRHLDVDLLMIVAAIGAAAIGQVFDGALLIVIFATSGALEDLATRRTEDSVRALLDLAPERAVRLDEHGGEQVVSAEALRVGDLVLVRPGERIPADAIVVGGASDVDQSSVTGEPVPMAKLAGDEVFAGTLNGAGALRVRVLRDPADSVVARIVAMVAEASATKARTQLFIEKVEQRYSVIVVVATLALFAVPLAFGEDLQGALLRAMTFMIVASPCAVVLATMPPLLSAIANAGRHGVLVKSAVAMEHLAEVEIAAFDKTGTLTSGRPRLACVQVTAGHTETQVLRLAAAAEQDSEHPLGRAVTAAARARGIAVPVSAGFLALPGRGVQATVEGRRVQVLSPAAVPGELPMVRRLEESGATAVVVLVDDAVAGVLGLRDTLSAGAAAAVGALAALGGRQPVLITGDNHCAAAHLALQVGIAEVHAGLLPEHKVEIVRGLPGRVLVVGDGVNDAPAMAAAHTSIAMGGRGADLTLQTADAIIIADELNAIPAVVALARRARRTMLTNLAIAATFIAVLVVWDLFWYLPLPVGVAGHEGSTILVALNGLRLLRNRAWLAG
ncbi:cadmium-translocating P-type ATPase [Mycolicibacterium fluoranthenivorans]|uniref:Cadmium-translocating P-type ATPase n=1 Tax=Mycolicibacterium fluoranthenivorans TaxID=258505 RepID=A0A7G8PD91_9MYCO|nr:heavy metal translocating P-type ATPase [Mycolicibacterium fluoranthenivorans]QNJ92307.1 cadmium-translocating P-type ATPase [Mycolicibacterium fluoranthenivorans]